MTILLRRRLVCDLDRGCRRRAFTSVNVESGGFVHLAGDCDISAGITGRTTVSETASRFDMKKLL